MKKERERERFDIVVVVEKQAKKKTLHQNDDEIIDRSMNHSQWRMAIE